MQEEFDNFLKKYQDGKDFEKNINEIELKCKKIKENITTATNNTRLKEEYIKHIKKNYIEDDLVDELLLLQNRFLCISEIYNTLNDEEDYESIYKFDDIIFKYKYCGPIGDWGLNMFTFGEMMECCINKGIGYEYKIKEDLEVFFKSLNFKHITIYIFFDLIESFFNKFSKHNYWNFDLGENYLSYQIVKMKEKVINTIKTNFLDLHKKFFGKKEFSYRIIADLNIDNNSYFLKSKLINIKYKYEIIGDKILSFRDNKYLIDDKEIIMKENEKEYYEILFRNDFNNDIIIEQSKNNNILNPENIRNYD